MRSTEPSAEGLVRLLWVRHLYACVSRHRQSRDDACAALPGQASQGPVAPDRTVLPRHRVRRAWDLKSLCQARRATQAVGLEVKLVGEPDGGNLQVRFDERRRETG